jgi:twitching motility protein PilU
MKTLTMRDSGDLGRYLKAIVDAGGSDLFLTVGAPPSGKVAGVVRPLTLPPLLPESVRALTQLIMTEPQLREFEARLECDLAIFIEGLGRFRANVYMQRGEVAMVLRYIQSRIPSMEELKMPAVLHQLALLKRGLVIIVGAAGAGKSTTLASMLDYRNGHRAGHILTIEDPIEFVHAHKQSIVSQREVGVDTHSFGEALRHAMREAPDVIMIGELRDQETLQHALNYAETGHLCISTMHANNASQAIERMLNFFPEAVHNRMLLDLSLNLHGVVAQRLVPGVGDKLVPVTEVMLRTPYIADLMHKGSIDQIRAVLAKSNELGMHTFDQSLFNLHASGEITLAQAMDNADSRTDLSVRLRLERGEVVASRF